MTVHRALTGSPLVKAASRDVVLEAAKRLGYRLNASARAMRTGRFDSIGLLIGHISQSSSLPNVLMQSLARELAERRYRFQLAAVAESDLDDPERLPQVLSELSVDGLLVKFDHHLPPRMQDLLNSSGLPIIYLNQKRAQDCVYPDEVGAAQAVTASVIAAGAQRLVYASCSFNLDDPNEHFSAVDRWQGFANACGTHPHVRLTRVIPPTQRVEAAMAAVRELAWPWSGIGYTSDETLILREAARRLGHAIDSVPWGMVVGPAQPTIPHAFWTEPVEAALAHTALEHLFAKLAQPGLRSPPTALLHPVQRG